MKDFIWLICIFIAVALIVAVCVGRMEGINHVHDQLIEANLAYYTVDAKTGDTKLVLREAK